MAIAAVNAIFEHVTGSITEYTHAIPTILKPRCDPFAAR
jgi:hypothetical protein